MMRTTVIIAAALAIASPASADVDDKVDFQRQILPIFLQNCAKCHGESKHQARMSLHTAEAMQEKWQADEHLLVPGDPEQSELYQRITLPDDNPKRMPKGADPLSKEHIELIAAWIQQGAVLTGATANTAATHAAPHVDHAAPAEEPALPDVPPAPPEAIDRLVAAGARVTQLYAGSSLLELSFAGRGEPATDGDVALLADVAEQVYSLHLAGGQVTPAGLAPLASLTNLASLHLETSSVTNDGLAHVAALAQLEYLNLYGTAITDDGLAHLAGLKRLRKLYLWQTKVSYDAAMALEVGIPGLSVNLGYDHPVVAKKRLTEELAAAKKQVEDAKAAANKAQQQLERAQKDVEAAAARTAEVEKQLKALDGQADGS
jgi:mono/diheme cytochrome c family protein